MYDGPASAGGGTVQFYTDYDLWLQVIGAGNVRTIDFESLPDGSEAYAGALITPEFNYTAQGVTFASPHPVLRKIEHRMFSHITMNWRGRPLVSHEVIVRLIANTTTAAGLKIRAALDRNHYPSGQKVSRAEFQRLQLTPAAFHGDWNYTLKPQ